MNHWAILPDDQGGRGPDDEIGFSDDPSDFRGHVQCAGRGFSYWGSLPPSRWSRAGPGRPTPRSSRRWAAAATAVRAAAAAKTWSVFSAPRAVGRAAARPAP